MNPGPELGGSVNTMMDIGYGITAYKRLNGEYLVSIEEDLLAKSILYRWCPNGTCNGCDTVKVLGIDIDSAKITVEGSNTVNIAATINPSGSCRIVNWFSENSKIVRITEGHITGTGPGTTKIWAMVDDGDFPTHAP
ncbi:MAG: Ig-like domain-containing protein [Bacteroidales bacterium]|nr:Ig-like domain-containing protein [Bacteroidales bacterium]